MTVVYKAPGCAPEVREVGNTLKDLRACVGGRIETVTLASDAVIICNEEGRLLGLPHNCEFCALTFAGPFLVAGVAGEEFASLDTETAKRIVKWMGGGHNDT